MKLYKALMFIAMAGFLLCSCEYEWIQPEKKPIPETVSFSNDIMPIFNNGCNISGCHSAGASPPDLTEANAYSALFDGGYIDIATPESSRLYVSMATGGSMQFYTTAGDEDIVLAWIQQGAENN
jgi:hypothetical protein